jgi:hypothetical protein
LLYGLVLSQLAALAVVELSGPPNALRLTLRWGLALGALVTMAAWIGRNRAAIDLQDWCQCAPQTVTIRVIESRRPVPAPARLDEPPVWAEEPAETVPR